MKKIILQIYISYVVYGAEIIIIQLLYLKLMKVPAHFPLASLYVCGYL